MPSRTSSDDAPGFLVAGGAHALGLVLLVWNFSHPPVLEPTIETIPVEMITTSDLNQITNGEKNAKQMDQPQRRADKVAELEDHKDMAPTPDATKDTPPEPTPEKTIVDPGQAPEKPPEPVVAAVPPPPAPAPPPAAAPPAPPVPTPPEKPVETSDAKPEPPKADAPPVDAPLPPEKPVEKAEAAPKEELKPPPPPDAEPVAPAPPPRPKVEAKKPEPPKHAKAEPKKPVPRPKPVKLAKLEPVAPPPPPPPQPQPKPEKLFDKVSSLLDRMKPDKPLDKVASLLDHLKPDPVRPVPVARPEPVKVEAPKPVERPKSGNEVKEAKPRDDFSPDKIAAMLSHEAPQRKASTGHALAQVASLGSPTAHAEKLSPSMAAQLDGWLIDHYRGCWSYFGLGAAQDYVPTIRIHMAQDGSLIGQPAIVNPPRDPNLQSLADSAIRAVNKCNPLPIPERFRPYYDQGYRQRVVRFDPKEMS